MSATTYRDLISFDPIESVVQLREANARDKAESLVKSFAVSDRMSTQSVWTTARCVTKVVPSVALVLRLKIRPNLLLNVPRRHRPTWPSAAISLEDKT
jgi:Family of unknown function (DUF6079)